MPHRLIRSIDGRRGGSLAIIAAVFVMIGQSFVRVQTDARMEVLSWLPDWFTRDVLGAALMVLASVALMAALVSKLWKWALVVGYTSAFAAAVMLAAIYLGAAVFSVSTTAYFSGGIYLAFSALIYLNAGWDEPRPRPPLTDAQRQVLASPPEGDR